MNPGNVLFGLLLWLLLAPVVFCACERLTTYQKLTALGWLVINAVSFVLYVAVALYLIILLAHVLP